MREHAGDENSGASLAAELQSLASEAQSLGQQWGASEAVTTALRTASQTQSLGDVYATQVPDAGRVTRAMLPGATSNLRLSVVSQQSSESAYRVLAVLLISVLFLISVACSRSALLHEAVARSPQIAGVAFGIAWWFLLTPAGVGLAIAVAFGIAALWFPWAPIRDLSRSTSHAHTSRPR